MGTNVAKIDEGGLLVTAIRQLAGADHPAAAVSVRHTFRGKSGLCEVVTSASASCCWMYRLGQVLTRAGGADLYYPSGERAEETMAPRVRTSTIMCVFPPRFLVKYFTDHASPFTIQRPNNPRTTAKPKRRPVAQRPLVPRFRLVLTRALRLGILLCILRVRPPRSTALARGRLGQRRVVEREFHLRHPEHVQDAQPRRLRQRVCRARDDEGHELAV